MMNSDLTQFLEKGRQTIEPKLDQMLRERFLGQEQHSSLFKAMHHALMAGGKRLRPLFLLHASELVGGTPDHASYAAVAMEFIHTYSLIHDDLPAMDNADLRRGKPTTHTIYGDGMAVLAGDGLLTEAFAILANGPEERLCQEADYTDVLRLIATGAGVRGMVRGQELDLDYEGKPIDLETLSMIDDLKTGALFKASLEAGAVLGGANSEDRHRLRSYASHIGMAFQIRDDLLDLDSSSEVLGKTAGQDESNQKATYPALLGYDAAREKMNQFIETAIACLGPLRERSPILTDLAHLIGNRKH